MGYRVIHEPKRGDEKQPMEPKESIIEDPRPRLFGILTAYKEEMFLIKEQHHVDFFKAGE